MNLEDLYNLIMGKEKETTKSREPPKKIEYTYNNLIGKDKDKENVEYNNGRCGRDIA